MKLELKHLAPYLPYELRLKSINDNWEGTLIGLKNDNLITGTKTGVFVQADKPYNYEFAIPFKTVKPILRPLSDLTKEIDHNGERFVPIKEIERLFTVEIESEGNGNFEMANILLDVLELPYCIVQKLLEWHFDIFGLIDKGLAIKIRNS